MVDTSTRPRNLCWAISVVGLVLFVIGWVIMSSGNCTAMVPTLVAAANVILLGVLGAWRCSFARNQAIEEEGVRLYRKEHGNTELFNDADEAVRLATRANQQFMKYAVPTITVALGLMETIFGLVVWRNWGKQPMFPVAPSPMGLAILAVVCCIAVLIAGSFFVGASRERGCRWLRPSGAWLFFTGFLFLAGGVALFLEFFGKAIEVADIYVARTAMAIVIVLAIELILSVIIEFYRPRMPGEEERPLPESRILALFTEPGGIARNVAASLDYQFGFDVSEAWFYHFLERTVVPLLVIMALTLWLQTCLVVVSTEENGIMERFGKVVSMEPLPPGLYFKLPSPFERLNRFPVERIQSITINGHDIVEEHEEEEEAKADEHDDGHGHNQKPEKKDKEEEERVVLWSTSHDDHEQPFIVAMKQEAQQVAKEGAGAPPLSIGLMAAHIPMYYKVRSKDFYNYYYKHNNPGKTLRNIATRELLSFMAQSDFTEVLGGRRHEAGKILQNRIQKIADEMELGVDIVFVSLAGLHPPVSVGSAYDNVEAAQETKHQQILLAKAYAAGSAPAAQSVRASLINQAEAYKQDRIRVSSAEAERFDRQLKGYLAAPRIFKLNTYLDEFLTSSANTRKFILAGNPHEEVFNLDLEKKISSSLLDLNLDEDEPPAGNDNPSAAPAQ